MCRKGIGRVAPPRQAHRSILYTCIDTPEYPARWCAVQFTPLKSCLYFQGILLNDEINLDWVFKNSIIVDTVKVRPCVPAALCFIHVRYKVSNYEVEMRDAVDPRRLRFSKILICVCESKI